MKPILLLFGILFFYGIRIDAQIVDAVNYTNGQRGYVDSKGNWVGRTDYDVTWWDKEDQYGTFELDGKRGAVNSAGKIIIPNEYDHINTSTNKKYLEVDIKNGNTTLHGLYDRSGKLLIPCKYLCIGCYNLGISVVDINGKCGVFDYNGKEILEVKYANYAAIDKPGTMNILNLGGKGVLNSFFTPTNIIGGKWGVCNDKGEVVVPFDYEGCEEAAENLYAVNRGGKWGLFANGQEIVSCKFDGCPKFINDVATVKVDGEIQMIKNPLKDKSKIQIAQNFNANKSNKKTKGQAISRYPAPDSDVDKNIPTAKASANNTFAFIIANENYPDAPVPYSLNDGRMFKEYCQKALGLPEKNINLYEDATFGNIITAVEKMKQIADAYDGDASVIFYYAGHGFPDEKQNTAYLLPIDGNASDITTTGYSLAKLYQELSELKLKSSIVFLDACFSGSKREDQMLSESRGVAIKVKEEAPKGNMLVFSAAQGDETAHQMEEKHHGLFTYYLLKELQATGGDVDMGTLTEYVTKQVKRQSVVINNKKQTPTVIPSQSLSNSWQSMKLK